MKILILHGPNLNLLGTREPGVYGRLTLAEIDERIAELAEREHVELRVVQSNHEGTLIDELHGAREAGYDGVVINAAAYTHTSVALRDAITAIELPTVEVHISNVHAREPFRHQSLIAPVCLGQVVGLGWRGYLLALEGLIGHIRG
jgi:3-dehydroquinate dehydratase II